MLRLAQAGAPELLSIVQTRHEPGVPLTDALNIPEGYRAVTPGGGFIAHNGPLYARMDNGQLQLGFRIEQSHCNPLQICHGGMLATLADMQLALGVIYQAEQAERRFLPTISLQLDYLAPAPLGSWLHGETQVLRGTRNMVFVQALLHADGALVARASGILKQGPLMEPGSGRDPFKILNS